MICVRNISKVIAGSSLEAERRLAFIKFLFEASAVLTFRFMNEGKYAAIYSTQQQDRFALCGARDDG